ncbi:MAG: 2-amino-4-hydroxy-6-hydroxymethyldihydropteridine diphosphokinase [Candidatus Symbiothrix sp.]|jgi:2-amino-4-hydroxy-6-hydroxymethyldihydropteridine diphosphokinase|nr:2-amino-4-hydroxy-6-hydroxymethyldihydropteridine diphosphokinase [Candidatus Symbiothrix sp.]
MTTAYLALGTNLGDKEQNLSTAMELLNQQAGTITARSSIHKTEPWGFESANGFLNMVIRIETTLAPLELLHTVKTIEKQMGRPPRIEEKSNDKSNAKYQDRIIDIDIILYGDVVYQSDELTLPHPLYKKRPFVLEPLNEIYPHPVCFTANPLQIGERQEVRKVSTELTSG